MPYKTPFLLKVKPGDKDGNRLEFKNQGDSCDNNRKNLLFVIKEERHKIFDR